MITYTNYKGRMSYGLHTSHVNHQASHVNHQTGAYLRFQWHEVTRSISTTPPPPSGWDASPLGGGQPFYTGGWREALRNKVCCPRTQQGPVSWKPRKLLRSQKPILVSLYLKAERWISQKNLVWRETSVRIKVLYFATAFHGWNVSGSSGKGSQDLNLDRPSRSRTHQLWSPLASHKDVV